MGGGGGWRPRGLRTLDGVEGLEVAEAALDVDAIRVAAEHTHLAPQELPLSPSLPLPLPFPLPLSLSLSLSLSLFFRF